MAAKDSYMIATIKITPKGGNPVYLCMSPEEISYGADGKFSTFDFITTGEVKIPKGKKPEELSWKGKFPGAARKREPYVFQQYYRPPAKYIDLFRRWRDKGTVCNIVIPSAGINKDFYVADFTGQFSGGFGDFDYDVKFVEAIPVYFDFIRTKNKNGKTTTKVYRLGKISGGKKRSKSKKSSAGTASGSKNVKKYIVKKGDTLWSIALKAYGDGAMYTRLLALNSTKLKTPDDLKEGMTITVPERWENG